MVKRVTDLAGNKFGYLRVLALNREVSGCRKKKKWICVCDCGAFTCVESNNLKTGHTKSCGCHKIDRIKESKTTHGQSKNPLYTAWYSMKARCNKDRYLNHHGKNIRYCTKWETLGGFLEDMTEGYIEGLELDRIDPYGDYCKENCRWVDQQMQSYNCGIAKNNTSGRTGVYWAKNINKWEAAIGYKHKKMLLGYFDSFEEACLAREKAELDLYGKIKE